MGELEEKESLSANATASSPPPPQEATETEAEPTETDKMLGPATKLQLATPPATTKTSPQKQSNGEEIINIPDQKDQNNSNSAAADEKSTGGGGGAVKINFTEEREVKPKKIPIGGLKLPGFFMKTKPKIAGSGETDGENDETAEDVENVLLEKTADGEKSADEQTTPPTPNKNGTNNKKNKKQKSRDDKSSSMSARLRSFFVRKSTAAKKQAKISANTSGNNVGGEDIKTSEGSTAEATLTEDGREKQEANNDQQQQQQQAPKRSLLHVIKLPTAAGLVTKKKSSTDVNDVELGLSKAGLASMETLDDSIKDQDCVDKAPSKNSGISMDNDKLKKSPSKSIADQTKSGNGDSANAAVTTNDAEQHISFIQRLRGYSCSVDDALIAIGTLLFLLLIAVIGYVLSHESLISPPLRDGRFIDAVTSCGMVEGVQEDGAFAFRQIPYALPPIGKRRWQNAQLIENIDYCWPNKLRAHNASDEVYCTQLQTNGINGTQLMGKEDCLYLDVVTPHVGYTKLLPVIVLIGADTLTGPSPGILRPSARYARLNDVVFVRPNFRLGALGFLALDVLTQHAKPHSSGNYALSDIIAVLKWIQLNIKNFGGDPKSVTLLGHRAGATLVSALATSAQAQPLYARAWASSPSSMFPGKPLSHSEQRNQPIMLELNCTNIDCLHAATVEQVWNATPDTWLHLSEGLPAPDENPSAQQHEWLVLDGYILQRHPAEIWKEQRAAQASDTTAPRLVMGTTAHEAHTEKLHSLHKNWTRSEIHNIIAESRLGQLKLTDEAIERYNASEYRGLVAMITDIRNICPLLINARNQPSVPFYVVTQGQSSEKLSMVSADVLAILGRYEPQTAEQRRFVYSMQQLFYYFVAHGRVPQYDPRRRVLNIGQDPLATNDHPNCNFWISNDIVPRYARLN